MQTQTETKKPNGKADPKAGQALAPAQENKPAHAAPTIRDLIEQMRPRFADVLPEHVKIERFMRVTLACISKTPALQNCTRDSLLSSLMQAAQLGVEPTGVLGSAYLVPYGKECTLIVGYRGLIDLARRSGQIESIEAHVVHANDRFTCHYGLEPRLHHEPAWEGEPGPFKAVYAIAKLKDGGKQIEVMTRAQVEAIRNGSKAGKSGPWVSHFEEMARKTVVRRIAKYLPLTPELADALTMEEEQERIDLGDVGAAAKGTEGLKAIVKAGAAVVDTQAHEEPPHDAQTGEVREPGADDEPPQTDDGVLLDAQGNPL